MKEIKTKKTLRITINVQLVYLGVDGHFLHLAPEQLFLDDLDEPRTDGIKLGGEVRGVHLDRLTIGFIVNVLLTTTERSEIARGRELVDLLQSCGRKVDEPDRRMVGVSYLTFRRKPINIPRVLPPVIKIEPLRGWRDSSAAQRSVVVGESLLEGLQLVLVVAMMGVYLGFLDRWAPRIYNQCFTSPATDCPIPGHRSMNHLSFEGYDKQVTLPSSDIHVNE